jgi:tripartite-type tricarboxylate transporter receptor subunit TctC
LFAETIAGFEAFSWFGVGVKAGTPKPMQDLIEKEMMAIFQDPTVKTRFAGLVAETHGSSAQEFQAHIIAERKKWGKLITDNKIKVE